MKFIKANIKLSATIGEIYREEKYEYPLEALREAVINAVVHRDYMRTGRDIRVGIYDNRIEIISPGELPATFSVDDIGKIDLSELRNHVLGRVFSELKLIEQWGLGFKKIIRLCKQHGIDRPGFIEEAQNFKVIFHSGVTETSLKCHRMSPNVTNIGDIKEKQYVGVTKEERKEIIYQLIKDDVKFNISDLELIFDISLRTVKRDLAELKIEKNIEYVGTPKNGYYRVRINNRDEGKEMGEGFAPPSIGDQEMNENTSNFQVESQKQTISIKEAKVSDAPAIYKLSLCFSGATQEWTQPEIEETIENRQCYYVLTSEQNGEIIGYALARFAWGKLHLMDIVVKGEMRLRGVGKKMMKQLIDFAKSKELSEVYLEVRASNIPAVKLYQSLSFKNRFIFRGLYDGEDGIAMYLPLEKEKERTLVC